ncbi:MAG: PAS domain S-box protein [Anaerolineae bacterium]|nr:PAS domain S-box protein [Anaerolineae bacterium]
MASLELGSSLHTQLAAHATQVGCSPEELIRRWLAVEAAPLPLDPVLLDALPIAMVLCQAQQPDFPIVYVNAAFEQDTGYTRAEVLGRNPRFLQAKDRDQPELATLRAALDAGRGCRVVLRNYRKNGTLFYNQVRLVPLLDVTGTLTHFLSIQNDLTQLHQTEANLTHTEQMYRLLEQYSQDVISLHAPDGRFLYLNRTLNHPGSYTREEVLAMSPQELAALVHPEDLPRTHEEAHQQVLEGASITRLEYRMREKLGSYVWVENDSLPVRDASGQVVQIISSTRDITRRKQAEIALRASEARLRSLLETQTAFVLRTDLEGNFTYVNRAFSERYAWLAPPGGWIGKSSMATIYSDDHEQAFEAAIACLQQPGVPVQAMLRKPVPGAISSGRCGSSWASPGQVARPKKSSAWASTSANCWKPASRCNCAKPPCWRRPMRWSSWTGTGRCCGLTRPLRN